MIKVLELFGGIVACTTALKRLNVPYKVVDYVEINPWSVKSYNAMNNTNFQPQDITKWDKIVDCDLIMHGSPCQDFSLTGKQKGGDQGSGTRSSLMYESLRIIKKLQPKYVIWENVKGVLSGKHKHNFENYLKAMSDLGYTNTYQVLNAKDYGIPQSRERLFVVSVKNGDYIFPDKQKLTYDLSCYLRFRHEDDITDVFYKRFKEVIDSTSTLKEFQYYLESRAVRKGVGTFSLGLYNFNEYDTVTTINGLTGTITCRNSQNYCKKYYYNNRLYKPSPLMCWLLMGFTPYEFMECEQVCPERELYNQAGNSIVVNVLVEILRNLIKPLHQV